MLPRHLNTHYILQYHGVYTPKQRTRRGDWIDLLCAPPRLCLLLLLLRFPRLSMSLSSMTDGHGCSLRHSSSVCLSLCLAIADVTPLVTWKLTGTTTVCPPEGGCVASYSWSGTPLGCDGGLVQSSSSITRNRHGHHSSLARLISGLDRDLTGTSAEENIVKKQARVPISILGNPLVY